MGVPEHNPVVSQSICTSTDERCPSFEDAKLPDPASVNYRCAGAENLNVRISQAENPQLLIPDGGTSGTIWSPSYSILGVVGANPMRRRPKYAKSLFTCILRVNPIFHKFGRLRMRFAPHTPKIEYDGL